jgi:hypothetical protein
MNTAVYLLRVAEMGMSFRDLALVSVGMVFDMMTEAQNDSYKYPFKASQADMDNF